jgi:hypothetical protein
MIQLKKTYDKLFGGALVGAMLGTLGDKPASLREQRKIP